MPPFKLRGALAFIGDHPLHSLKKMIINQCSWLGSAFLFQRTSISKLQISFRMNNKNSLIIDALNSGNAFSIFYEIHGHGAIFNEDTRSYGRSRFLSFVLVNNKWAERYKMWIFLTILLFIFLHFEENSCCKQNNTKVSNWLNWPINFLIYSYLYGMVIFLLFCQSYAIPSDWITHCWLPAYWRYKGV